jgi:NAD(P)-dependent dehydrogenase (short-subunit alcohol dehydrogenase family)
MKLRDQVALVTGASRGLGLAIARALAAEGAAVACMARAGGELDRAGHSLAAQGAQAVMIAGDVTRDADADAAVRRTLQSFGRLDIVVLNAGTWQAAPVHETSEEQWDRLLDLNLKGAFLTLRHAVPHLIARRGGTIVGISSIGGLVGAAGEAAYRASKWGLRGLLESVALELKPHRVRVSIVHPHSINSAGADYAPDSAERDRHVEPEDVARLVAFVCCAPSYVSLGNVTVWPLSAGIGQTG